MCVSYPRDVPEVEKVVYLGGRGQKAGDDGVVELQRGLSQDAPDGLHLLLKLLQLLVYHGAIDTLDLRLLQGRRRGEEVRKRREEKRKEEKRGGCVGLLCLCELNAIKAYCVTVKHYKGLLRHS